MSSKVNKLKQFWSYYFGTCISKGARTEIERINRNYESHRAKSAAGNQGGNPEQQTTTAWRALRKLHKNATSPC